MYTKLSAQRKLTQKVRFMRFNEYVDPMKNQAAVYLSMYIRGVLRSNTLENSEIEFCCEKLLMLI